MPENMEFTKTSNVGPLIAAVLVGLLSLCIPFVVRMSPDDIDSVLRGFTEVSNEVVDDKDSSTERQISQSPAELLADIGRGYRQLSALNMRVRHGEKYNPTKVKNLITFVRLAATDVGDHRAASVEQKDAAALNYFKCLFMAAELEPHVYSKLCQESGEQILRARSSGASGVSLLLSFHTYGISRVQNPVVLQNKMTEFSRAHPDQELVIEFYLLVAHELIARRESQLAKHVLELGLKIYAQHPSRSKLANALIDLKIKTKLHQFQ